MVGLYQIPAGNVITCLEPLLNCQCHNFQVFKDYIGLGLTSPALTSKKYRNKT